MKPLGFGAWMSVELCVGVWLTVGLHYVFYMLLEFTLMQFILKLWSLLECDTVIEWICPQLSSHKICETQQTLITFISWWHRYYQKKDQSESPRHIFIQQKSSKKLPLRKRKKLEFPSRVSAADNTLIIDLLVSFGHPKDSRRSIKNEDINTVLYHVTVHTISLDERL